MRARAALSDIPFDSCFSSPHTRARQSTEIVWPLWQQQQEGTVAEGPIYLPSLAEVDLGWFQGLRNGEEQQQQQLCVLLCCRSAPVAPASTLCHTAVICCHTIDEQTYRCALPCTACIAGRC